MLPGLKNVFYTIIFFGNFSEKFGFQHLHKELNVGLPCNELLLLWYRIVGSVRPSPTEGQLSDFLLRTRSVGGQAETTSLTITKSCLLGSLSPKAFTPDPIPFLVFTLKVVTILSSINTEFI